MLKINPQPILIVITKIRCYCHFYLQPTSPDDIHDILSNLKDDSNGQDNIDAIFAKQVSSIISNPLTILSSSIVPTNLKITKVIPIYNNTYQKN